MRKLMLTMMAICGCAFAVQAQKIGVFSSEDVIQALPEHKVVEAKLESYQKDSLAKTRDEMWAKYEAAVAQAKKDSADKKPKPILEYNAKTVRELTEQLAYWQQIAQRMSQEKYMELSKPLADKVRKALLKVQKEKGVTIVFRPEVFDQLADQSGLINLIVPVAKELGIKTNE